MLGIAGAGRRACPDFRRRRRSRSAPEAARPPRPAPRPPVNRDTLERSGQGGSRRSVPSTARTLENEAKLQARDRIDRRTTGAKLNQQLIDTARPRRRPWRTGSSRPRSASSCSTAARQGLRKSLEQRHAVIHRGAGGPAAHRPAGRRPPSCSRPRDRAAGGAPRAMMARGRCCPRSAMRPKSLGCPILAELVRLRKQIAEGARPAWAATCLVLADDRQRLVAADRRGARKRQWEAEKALARRAPARVKFSRAKASDPEGSDRQARAGPSKSGARNRPGRRPARRRAQAAGRPARTCGRLRRPRTADPRDRGSRPPRASCPLPAQGGVRIREFGGSEQPRRRRKKGPVDRHPGAGPPQVHGSV